MKQVLIQGVDEDVRSKVCQMLNKRSALNKDFRGLAAKMNYNKDEMDLFERSDNPADALLKDWGATKNATVGSLIKFLEKMSRDDVVETLKKGSVIIEHY